MDAPLWGALAGTQARPLPDTLCDTGGHTGTAPTQLHQISRRQPTFLACLFIGERFLLRALMPLEHGC
ncbi:hypothetical protein [Segatella oulorum]|uniref:hypothetical protein n=1 Tax=Segatella oulorum TaxID=28136 RepID=UPI0012DE8A24|nr:hypothetical protein [Segatella oulorum]